MNWLLATAGALAFVSGCGRTSATCSPRTEVPDDGLDQDCDGADLADLDGDGYPAPEDCNDLHPRVHPGADDAPYDGLDQDCGGGDDLDADQDGDRPVALGGTDCDDQDPLLSGQDRDGDGVTGCGSDCDDADPLVAPGLLPVCGDLRDNNCDGLSDCSHLGPRRAEDWITATVTTGIRDVGATMALLDLDVDGQMDFVGGTPFEAPSFVGFGPLEGPRSLFDGAEFIAAPSAVAVGDLDGNGYDDLWVGQLYGSAYAVLAPWSAGQGSLEVPECSTGWGVATGDLDHDGRTDVVGGFDYPTVFYGPIENFCNFDELSAFDTDLVQNAWRNLVEDLDGDGVHDLVAFGARDVRVFPGPIPRGTVLPRAGDRGFLVGEVSASQHPQGAILDADGDGAVDLFLSQAYLFADVRLGPVKPDSEAVSLGFCTSSVTDLGDADGDGFDDLATWWNGYWGDGLAHVEIRYGPFAGPVGWDPRRKADFLFEGEEPRGVIAGDINQDGLSDLAVSLYITDLESRTSPFEVFKVVFIPGTAAGW